MYVNVPRLDLLDNDEALKKALASLVSLHHADPSLLTMMEDTFPARSAAETTADQIAAVKILRRVGGRPRSSYSNTMPRSRGVKRPRT